MRFRRDSNRLHSWALTRGRAGRAGGTRARGAGLGDGRTRTETATTPGTPATWTISASAGWDRCRRRQNRRRLSRLWNRRSPLLTIAPTASRATQRSARPTARRRPRELAGITYATATGMWEKHGPARLGAGAKASPVTLCTTIQATVAAVTKATNLVATTPETPVTWISSVSVGRNLPLYPPRARITRF